MPTTRRTVVRRGSGPRRKLVWARRHDSTDEAENNTNLLSQLMTDLGVNAVLGSTVTRIRLTWMARAVTLTANDAQSFLGMGIIVVQQGGLAGLDPLNAEHVDWMWWRAQPLAATTADFPVSAWGDVDIRSQRKMDEIQEDLIFSHTVDANVTNIRLDFATSVLLKLP